jgi:hypothetical protein
MVNTEIKAKAKITVANFFHTKDPSFKVIYFNLHLLRRRGKEFIQWEMRNGRWEIENR